MPSDAVTLNPYAGKIHLWLPYLWVTLELLYFRLINFWPYIIMQMVLLYIVYIGVFSVNFFIYFFLKFVSIYFEHVKNGGGIKRSRI